MPTHPASGATLSYTDRGSGPPLVLLHGFPLDGRVWDDQAAGLADRCRVIVPDLRGFGQSKSDAPFTIESLADDVHALLAGIGALPCVLGGLSMGGYVALAYAKKYPADLRGLALIDTRAEGDSPEGKAGRAKMIETARGPGGAKAVADQMMPKMVAADARDHRPDLVRRLRGVMEACPPLTIEHALAAMRDRPDFTADLSSIRTPALIVVGDTDAITPPAMAETLHKGIAGSTLAVVKGAGHMAIMEQPAQVNQALRRFMDGVTG